MFQDQDESLISVQKTLSDIKKERKISEQDAMSLQNRINLLQLEDEKSWKLIKKTQKLKNIIEEARKLKDDKRRKMSQVLCTYEKQRLENQQKILLIKENIHRNQIISRENMRRSKKQAYLEVRQLKGHIFAQKIKNEQDLQKAKEKRSLSVKVERIKNSIKKQNYHELKLSQFKEEYVKKIREELERKNLIQSKIADLEHQETELIRKLQNTQTVQQKVVSDFESLKYKSSSKFCQKINEQPF